MEWQNCGKNELEDYSSFDLDETEVGPICVPPPFNVNGKNVLLTELGDRKNVGSPLFAVGDKRDFFYFVLKII